MHIIYEMHICGFGSTILEWDKGKGKNEMIIMDWRGVENV